MAWQLLILAAAVSGTRVDSALHANTALLQDLEESDVKCCASSPVHGEIIARTKTAARCGGYGKTHKYEVPKACCSFGTEAEARACQLAYICLHQPKLVEKSCSLKAQCEAFRAAPQELPLGIGVSPDARCRQKTLFIVRHGESEANLEIERRGYEGYLKILSAEMRERYRDPALTMEGEYADRLDRLYATVKKFNVTAEAFMSSPLLRAVETAVIGFQDELSHTGRHLEMLPIVREKKKLMVEFGDMGRMYGPATANCTNAGLETHVKNALLNLSKQEVLEDPSLASSKLMLEGLQSKLDDVHLQLSVDDSLKAKIMALGDEYRNAEQWLNACEEWWDGPKAEWSVSERMANVGKALGLRDESTVVLVGHSSFWRDYFEHYINKARFSYFASDEAGSRKRLLAKKLRGKKLENAAIVKVVVDCSGEDGPCDFTSDVDDLDTRFQE